MAEPSSKALLKELLTRHGRTFAEELRIPVEKNTPSALFQLLFASLMFSARIPAPKAAEAITALIKAKLTTPEKMAAASWQDRVDIITWHGYKRYDESTSSMLGQAAERVLEQYHGDLRNLREAAQHDVLREKERLMEFKGIGRVGADIFMREIQGVWEEAYPYVDERVLKAARQLGLGDNPQALARLVPKKDFPRFAAALVRADLRKELDELGGKG